MSTPLEDTRSFKAIDLGHATDTTITRVSAGVIAVEGNTVYMAGGTDLAVADGGTGASTLADGGIVIGNGTGAVEVVAAGTTTQILVGGGASTKPVWGTDIPTAVTIGSAYITRVGGTDVTVADGGTGASTLDDGGLMIGNGTGAVEVVAPGTTSQILVGGGAATAPVWGADIPTAVTIGSSYVYRAGGTDVPVTDGGTGASTATGGFDALCPMTAVGDMIYGGASGTVTTLAAGTEGQILTAHGAAAPTWESGRAYAGMYFYEAASTITVSVDDSYYAFNGLFSVGLANGWTFVAGSTGPIASIATASGGTKIQVTDVAHGLLDGDYVNIQSANHNGTSIVSNKADDTFELDIAFDSDETGTWTEGDYLLAGVNAAGVYHLTLSVTARAGASAKEFKFEPVINATHCDKSVFDITTSGTTHQSGSATGIYTIAAGDRVWAQFKNQTDTQDLIAQHANLNLVKI